MNTTTVQQPVAIACLFTWTGFVCAISFMEAWLKFRAPGVTLPIGLGIGRIVFGALNRVEWVFALVVCLSAILNSPSVFTVPNILLMLIVLILVLQTAWLLPALDVRAKLHIENKPIGPSNLHLWFVGAEFTKVVALVTTAVFLFQQKTN
jgi:hypothetical protein